MVGKELTKEEARAGTKVRCLECFARIDVPARAKRVDCFQCHTRFLIYWPSPDVAKIKGIAPETL